VEQSVSILKTGRYPYDLSSVEVIVMIGYDPANATGTAWIRPPDRRSQGA